MSPEFKFFIYLLERYAARNGETADVAYKRLAAHNAVDYAMNMYELYHVESLDNAFADLDRKLGIKRENVAQST
ncbi:MAG: DUF3791 domain-containing protein [Kiritimatiellia bacterium]